MASMFYQLPYPTEPEDAPLASLPIRMVREEVLKLVPQHTVMVDFMLEDLEQRTHLLTDREQVQELLISILAALNPAFPLKDSSKSVVP